MKPTITDIIDRIQEQKEVLGITLYPKATLEEIQFFEKAKGITLPADIKAFYLFCNGFESAEDLFRIIPLEEILSNYSDLLNPKDFHIAEYMIYSDSWTVHIDASNPTEYTIYNDSVPIITLTQSFAEFLDKFLEGGVFDGLYKWREKLEGLNE